MSVIRMIKLFGWEPKMKERIYEKREDELVWTYKYRLMGLYNAIIGCV